MSKVYYQGETIREKAETKDIAGAYTDPDSIVITIRSPEGAIIINGEAMTPEDKGKFYYNYFILDDAEIGIWVVEVKATKGYIAVEQDEFTVLERLKAA